VQESKEKLRKRNEAGNIVEEKEMKRENSNGGGRGTSVSVLLTVFFAGANVCSPEVSGSKHVTWSCS
jgi:hypothetical protein